MAQAIVFIYQLPLFPLFLLVSAIVVVWRHHRLAICFIECGTRDNPIRKKSASPSQIGWVVGAPNFLLIPHTDLAAECGSLKLLVLKT
jgi:hypothetical protein